MSLGLTMPTAGLSTEDAMTRLAASDSVDLLVGIESIVARMMPGLSGPAARLANWLEGAQFEVVRTALAQRVLRELTSPRRLRPDDPAGEINILRETSQWDLRVLAC